MFSLMPNMPKCEKQLEHKWKMENKCMEESDHSHPKNHYSKLQHKIKQAPKPLKC